MHVMVDTMNHKMMEVMIKINGYNGSNLWVENWNLAKLFAGSSEVLGDGFQGRVWGQSRRIKWLLSNWVLESILFHVVHECLSLVSVTIRCNYWVNKELPCQWAHVCLRSFTVNINDSLEDLRSKLTTSTYAHFTASSHIKSLHHTTVLGYMYNYVQRTGLSDIMLYTTWHTLLSSWRSLEAYIAVISLAVLSYLALFWRSSRANTLDGHRYMTCT